MIIGRKSKLKNNKLIKKIHDIDWHVDWSGSFPLLEVYNSYRVYFNGLERIFGLSFSSFFIDYKKGIATIRLPENEYQALGKHVGEKLKKNNYAGEMAKDFKQVAGEIMSVISQSPNNFIKKLKLFNPLYEIFGAYNVATKVVFDVMYDELDKKTKKILANARKYSESFYQNNAIIFAKVAKLISEQTGYAKENILMMTQDELLNFIENVKIPDERQLFLRHKRSSVYFTKKKIYFLSAIDTDRIEKIWLNDSEKKILKGASAFKGKVKGRCKVILDYYGATIKSGEILVTGMTNPNYLLLMKKAAAIVTDGGGLLSHAAIVARELKKPCVIGTKIATKVLHNGDLVEVDADKGVVKIIK